MGCDSRFDDLSGTVLTGHHQPLRTGLTTRLPPVRMEGHVEADEVYAVAGHKGNPAAAIKKGAALVGAD
jgi:hypothetical protein